MCVCAMSTHLRGLASLPLLVLLGLWSIEEAMHGCNVTYKTQDYHRVSTQLYSVGLTQFIKQRSMHLDSSKEYN